MDPDPPKKRKLETCSIPRFDVDLKGLVQERNIVRFLRERKEAKKQAKKQAKKTKFQYLSDNKDQVFVDVNDVVNNLQTQYREYGRRKRSAFKPLVEQAFSTIVRGCNTTTPFQRAQGEQSEDSSSTTSREDDEETRRRRLRKKPSSNSQLMRLYGAKADPRNEVEETLSNESSTELIEISSGDEAKQPITARERIATEEYKHFRSEMNRQALFAAGPMPGPSRHRPNMFMTHRSGRELISRSDPRMLKRKKGDGGGKRVTFADFGGDEKVLEEVCKLILHIPHPEIYRQVGVRAPCGLLLHGPPGCGKTLLARAIAGEMNVELIQVSAPELIGGVSGESEERIRDLFERAYRNSPCVLFIDEVDAITPNREYAQKEMERRIVSQLLTCLDELNGRPDGDQVLVIGATNRPDSLDPALRRAGRFDREICLGIPDAKTREKILKVLCAKMNLAENFSYEELAQITPGFVGADLLSLTREATLVALNRIFGLIEAYENRERKNKRRRIEIADPEEVIIESSPSDESLPPELTSNELMLRQAEEAISQNLANEQHSLETRARARARAEAEARAQAQAQAQAADIDEEAGEGPSTRMDTDESTGPAGGDGEAEDRAEPAAEASNRPRTEPEAGAGAGSGAEAEAENDDDDTDTDYDDEEPIVANDAPALDTLVSWLHDPTPLSCSQLKDVCITQEDFQRALRFVQPSAKREGFATVPDVNWGDVGSLVDIRGELEMTILCPVAFRKQFESLGLRGPAGILICGPPGCGKTLLAKAVANEAGINFISVKGPELLNMYVGESERAVRRCFQRARNSAPCVIFFDELDALCPRRSDHSEDGATRRVVNQLLTEMDGVEDRKEVYLMAATNRPDIIDPAVLRPGRFDKVIYVGLPGPDDRVDILRAVTKNGTRPRLDADVNLEDIAKRRECDGFSGADLAALVREAGVQALKDYMQRPREEEEDDDITVGMEHFERALTKVLPSVSPEDRVYYENMRLKYQPKRSG